MIRPKDRAAKFLRDLFEKPGTVMGYYSTATDGSHIGKEWVFDGNTFKVVKAEGHRFPIGEPLSEFTAILVLTSDYEAMETL